MGDGWKQLTSHAAVGCECLNGTLAPFEHGLPAADSKANDELPAQLQPGYGLSGGVLHGVIIARPDA